jgi:hypothetical protein
VLLDPRARDHLGPFLRVVTQLRIHLGRRIRPRIDPNSSRRFFTSGSASTSCSAMLSAATISGGGQYAHMDE